MKENIKMKRKSFLIVGVLLSVLLLSSCEDRTELTAPNPQQGNVDFTTFVSIGNSLTAGYQNSSLYESAQIYAFGNLIAQQVGTSYAQPIISDPGTVGRIEIKSLYPSLTLTYNMSAGSTKNLSWPKPYNNLGIPGIVLADVLTATETANSYSKSGAIDLILRKMGTTQLTQAISLNPTFITLWIGNNDVLGFATSGGAKPASPTDAQVFTGLYSQLADALAATGAKVVVGNIPDVTTIPFFTTVGPALAQSLTANQVPGIYYQQHGQFSGSVLPVSALANYSVLITLLGSNYAPYIGYPSGKFYKDNNADITLLIAGGILDTTQAFALSPKNPWPDALILDAEEIVTAKNTTAAFNSTIATIASAKGFGLADINALLNQIRATDATGGTTYDGVAFATTYVTGGLFSLDGVHPTSRGQAVIANEFIKAINAKWGTSIVQVNISLIPGSLILAKMNSHGIPIFEKGTFDNLLL
jgi:lysophospholipase L1-like esterase